jgi:hypothetical protein
MLWSNSCPFLTFLTFTWKILRVYFISCIHLYYLFQPLNCILSETYTSLVPSPHHSPWFTFLSDFWRLRKLVFYSSLEKDSIPQKAELDDCHMLDITEHLRNFHGEQNLQAFWSHNEKSNKFGHFPVSVWAY